MILATDSEFNQVQSNLHEIRDRVQAAEQAAGRSPGSVRLVAVTKRNSPERVRLLAELGQLDLAENYPQELWSKIEALNDPNIRWHLIGHLQGNKAKKTVPMVKMIHAVDSLKLLHALDALARDDANSPLLCLQVNTSGESSKHGWSAESLLNDSESIAAFQYAKVEGLMTIAGYGTSPETARPCFENLRLVRDRLQLATGLALPELSMGMSTDFEAAIAEGATLVRVGSALFEGLNL